LSNPCCADRNDPSNERARVAFAAIAASDATGAAFGVTVATPAESTAIGAVPVRAATPASAVAARAPARPASRPAPAPSPANTIDAFETSSSAADEMSPDSIALAYWESPSSSYGLRPVAIF
jgi:hypothetical protein